MARMRDDIAEIKKTLHEIKLKLDMYGLEGEFSKRDQIRKMVLEAEPGLRKFTVDEPVRASVIAGKIDKALCIHAGLVSIVLVEECGWFRVNPSKKDRSVPYGLQYVG